MYSQYPFPIKKLVNRNLHAWKLFLSNFSATIWLMPSFDILNNLQYAYSKNFSVTYTNCANLYSGTTSDFSLHTYTQ